MRSISRLQQQNFYRTNWFWLSNDLWTQIIKHWYIYLNQLCMIPRKTLFQAIQLIILFRKISCHLVQVLLIQYSHRYCKNRTSFWFCLSLVVTRPSISCSYVSLKHKITSPITSNVCCPAAVLAFPASFCLCSAEDSSSMKYFNKVE